MFDHPISTPTVVRPVDARLVDPGSLAPNGSPSVRMPDVYLTECASCGGQFPSFRAICSECEDVAEDDGYRDGRKVI